MWTEVLALQRCHSSGYQAIESTDEFWKDQNCWFRVEHTHNKQKVDTLWNAGLFSTGDDPRIAAWRVYWYLGTRCSLFLAGSWPSSFRNLNLRRDLWPDMPRWRYLPIVPILASKGLPADDISEAAYKPTIPHYYPQPLVAFSSTIEPSIGTTVTLNLKLKFYSSNQSEDIPRAIVEVLAH